MRSLVSNAALRLLLVGSISITACAVIVVVTLATGTPRVGADVVMACAVLTLVAPSWLVLRRIAAWITAARAKASLLQESLDKALGKIRDFSVSQGRFVGNLAQEIKAPLAVALIHAEQILANSNEPTTVCRHAQSVAEDTQHLSDLVESFLGLVRPFVQGDEDHHVPVHFHDAVLEAVRRCQTLATARGVIVVAILAESDDTASGAVEVMGDAVLIETMIENLVRNAVQSAPRGTHVDLRVQVQGEEVLLSVRDRGAKVDSDQIDSMFDWFFEVPPPPRPSMGTGLSLAIAKRVAEHHRGTISLRNFPEGGCEFEIQMPRWRPEWPSNVPTTVQTLR